MKKNYSRRDFLKTVVITAGSASSAGALVGCGGSDNDDKKVSPTGTDTNYSLYPQSVASGDPRTESVILWTRVNGGSDTSKSVVVQVASDADFSSIMVQHRVMAYAEHDFCVRVKVTQLSPGMTYYYRFITDGVASKTGRTKTAPHGNDPRNIKFGFISCQDYVNGYYNTLTKYLESDHDNIDFIVHLGDYIYETTGDPSFQGNVRDVTFTRPDLAIEIQSGDSVYYAASDISNYRDLYKIYRADEVLRAVHEKFPFIVIWDDHEFSDDAWQSNGTFFDGMKNENNVERRRNAEQAFFEYQPIDVDPSTGNPAERGQLMVDREQLFSGNNSIYRSFRYGKNLNLMMTDFRSFRPDHAIPEDGHPGTVVMNNLATAQTLYSIPGDVFNFKAGVDAVLGGNPVADIRNPSQQELAVMLGALAQAVGTGALPLNSYVDVDTFDTTDAITPVEGDSNDVLSTKATLASLRGFLAAFNALLGQLGQTPFSQDAEPRVKDFLLAATVQAYMDPSLGQVDANTAITDQNAAIAKAASMITGNMDVVVINTLLNSAYNQLLAGVNAIAAAGGTEQAALLVSLGAPFADTQTMFNTFAAALSQQPGAEALAALSGTNQVPETTDFGVSYALMGKSGLAASFGSRYLVVKSTFELWLLYNLLVLGDQNIGNPYGSEQQLQILLNQTFSQSTWNVLGSSVSYTSLILDASSGTLGSTLALAGVPESTLPRTQFYMNVDHMDGFAFTRGTFISNSSGALTGSPAKPFQETNTVIISGDIHASFVTDHGGSINGRCVEFTTTAVSSGTFGTFTGDAIAGLLGTSDPTTIGAFTSRLPTFLQEGAAKQTASPQTLKHVDTTRHGVSIMELTPTDLTTTFYLLNSEANSELLTTPFYNDTTGLAPFWETVTYRVTKANGVNGEPIQV